MICKFSQKKYIIIYAINFCNVLYVMQKEICNFYLKKIVKLYKIASSIVKNVRN